MRYQGRRGGGVAVAALVVAMACAGLSTVAAGPAAAAKVRSAKTTTGNTLAGATGDVTTTRLTSPDRVQVKDSLGVLATFTVGARTVTVRGTVRVFGESTTTATVTSSTWVRLLPAPFPGSVDWDWLSARLADTSPDVLAVAAQYVTGAPARLDDTSRQYAGDASYGPLQADGTREEGSDFNDYLGVAWTYGTTVDNPETDQIRSLDCSGFVRMVLGYRGGVPLTLRPDGTAIPRRAVEMADAAPGVVIIPDTGVRPSRFGNLSPGDLVFFDGSTDDGTLVDHVGIYLGTDSAKAPRFVSSRKRADGPTMGDLGGKSVLTGTGLYATAFRSVRRV